MNEPVQRLPELLPGLDIEPDPAGLEYVEDKPGKPGRYTAARFLEKYPDKARNIARLLGKGVGQLEVANLVGCSVHTVRAFLRELPQDIAIQRQRQIDRFRQAGALALDCLLEKLEDPEERRKLSGLQLATIAGICEDKARGSVPASVTVNLNAPGAADLTGYLDRLQQARADDPGEMGLPPKREEAKEAAPGAGSGDDITEAEILDNCTAGNGITDSESAEKAGNTSEKGEL